MHHYIYKIVDLATNEYYIGMRSSKTQPDEDCYWGSGSNRVCRAAKKHSGNGFIKHILHRGVVDRASLSLLEEKLVTKELIETDVLCMNLVAGGMFGFNTMTKVHTTVSREEISNKNKGQKRSEETKRKMSNAQLGKKMSDETKSKLSKAGHARNLKNIPRTEETRKKIAKSHIGLKHSDETKQKLSEIMTGDCHPFFGKKRPEHSEKMKGNKNALDSKHSEESIHARNETRRKNRKNND